MLGNTEMSPKTGEESVTSPGIDNISAEELQAAGQSGKWS